MTRRLLALTAALTTASCAGPTVNLATPDPVKVDIAMRLDVYSHGEGSAAEPPVPPSEDPVAARRNRMADIQTFKDSRIVGEGSDGLLAIRVETPGDYGDYIRKTVAAENADRMALMKAEAEKTKSPLPEIQQGKAAIARQMAFKGEWIEKVGEDGTTAWTRKGE
jgi:hypothetical protein